MARRGAPAVGPQPGRDRDQPRAALGVADRERDADQPAQARPDVGHRRRAAQAVEPRRDQVGEPERGQRWDRGGKVPTPHLAALEAPPGRAVARPARAQHRRAAQVHQVGRLERGPPCLGAALRIAERKRRGCDPAHDHHHRRGAERLADQVPGELDPGQRVPLDHHRVPANLVAMGRRDRDARQWDTGGHMSAILDDCGPRVNSSDAPRRRRDRRISASSSGAGVRVRRMRRSRRLHNTDLLPGGQRRISSASQARSPIDHRYVGP